MSRDQVEDLYPLSSMQQAMLFQTLSAPDAGAYTEQLALAFGADLDPAAFRAAWDAILARHSILRTAFLWERREKPLQAVCRRVELPWVELDWRGVSAPERDRRFEALLRDDRLAPFDLTRAPLMRVTAVRADDGWRVVWTHHHLVLDGWSIGLVLGEVLAVYEASRRGVAAALPPVRPYREYISWLARRDPAPARAFWERHLAGLRGGTPIPLARPRDLAAAGAERHLQCQRVLDEPTVRGLRELCRRHQLTLGTVVQGAWALLLARAGAEEEVVFGSVTSGRSAELPGIESMVGLFVNTLPVRVAVDLAAPLVPWLQAFQATQAEARQHEHTPLVEVLRHAGVPHDAAPLQSIVAVENVPVDAALRDRLGPGLRLEDLKFSARAGVPLMLMAFPDRELLLQLVYDGARFDRAAVARLLGQLAVLLAGIASDAERTLGALPLMTDAERAGVLAWSDGPSDGGVAGDPGAALDVLLPPDATLPALVAAQVERTPEAVALVCGDASLTYRALHARARQLAHRLRGLGVGPDARVGVCVDRSVELVVAVLGIHEAGGAYVPLDPAYPADRLADVARQAGLAALLTVRRRPVALPELGVPVVALDAEAEALAALPVAPLPPSDLRPDHLAYVLFTSGSTGRPKGVAIEHRNAVAFLRWAAQEFTAAQLAGVLFSTSLSFDLSVFELFLPLVRGGRVILVENALALAALGERAAEVTLLNTVPSALSELLRAGALPPSLRTVNVAGEPLQDEVVRACYRSGGVERVYNLYGPTETTTYSTVALVPREGDAPSIGRPIAGTCVYVLDGAGRPVPPGVPGEIFIGGAGVARGYLAAPALTAERFLPDPFAGAPGARMYRTGDLARYRGDGVIDLMGRADHQVKLRGFRIELGEIEAALRRVPGVGEAVVLLREDVPGERALAGYLVADRDRGPADPEAQARRAGELVASWEALWGETYRQPPAADARFDTAGWNSSATGRAIPPAEMSEWVEATVARIAEAATASARPLDQGTRVLEVGCGTGLLLFRLAPRCARYLGTDLSAAALDRIRSGLGAGLEQVELAHLPAHALDQLPQGAFDVVVLNSVIQYFPSAEYLREVLAAAARRLAPGGVIFAGDVRNLALLEPFHAHVQAQRAPGDWSLAELGRQIDFAVAHERELLLDPAFFSAPAGSLALEGGARVLLKRGRSRNEMTCFRYDVLLGPGVKPVPEEGASIEWETARPTAEHLADLLGRHRAPLRVRGVANARVEEALRALAHVRDGARSTAAGGVAALRRRLAETGGAAQGVEPEALRALAEAHGYEVELAWSGSGEGRFDAQFLPAGWTAEAPPPPRRTSAAGALANHPLRTAEDDALAQAAQAALQRSLPEFMVPRAWVVLPRLPLTPNGKLDRRALPAPGKVQAAGGAVPPRDNLEFLLVQIWEELLGVRPVGVTDDFFALGGHSLLAVRMVAQIQRRLGQDLPLSRLSQASTIERLAQLLRTHPAAHPRTALVPIQTGGARRPLFCAQPAGGNVLCYVELARELGPGQPIYGLEAPSLAGRDGRGAGPRSVEEVAAHYLDVIRPVQAHGPYRLAGWSYGGIVAFEMAQQLARRGEAVELVAIFDTTLPTGRRPAAEEAEVSARRIARMARFLETSYGRELGLEPEALRSLPPTGQLALLIERALAARLAPEDVGPDLIRRFFQVFHDNIQAFLTYEPRPSSSPLVLFRATEQLPQALRDLEFAREDRDLGWGPLTPSLDLVEVPGDHITMFSRPHVTVLARELARVLDGLDRADPRDGAASA